MLEPFAFDVVIRQVYNLRFGQVERNQNEKIYIMQIFWYQTLTFSFSDILVFEIKGILSVDERFSKLFLHTVSVALFKTSNHCNTNILVLDSAFMNTNDHMLSFELQDYRSSARTAVSRYRVSEEWRLIVSQTNNRSLISEHFFHKIRTFEN